MKRQNFAKGVFLAVLIVGTITPLFTQGQRVQIALSPLVFELTGEQGETIEKVLRVANLSEQATITIKMEAEDMFPEGEEGRVRLQAPPEEQQILVLSRWISFDQEEFVLGPSEERLVSFKITIPETAEPKGHYAAVVAGTTGIEGQGPAGVGIIHRIGALVLLRVPGDAKEELSIASFETEKGYYEYGPVKLTARFENKGNVHVRPDAVITVTDIFGKKVAELPLEQRNVLPQAVRRLDVEMNDTWLWGIKYTAELKGVYGTANYEISPAKISFWAFPWKVAVAGLLVLIFFVLTRKRWVVAIKILTMGERGMPSR